jgi:hypothetical protein
LDIASAAQIPFIDAYASKATRPLQLFNGQDDPQTSVWKQGISGQHARFKRDKLGQRRKHDTK